MYTRSVSYSSSMFNQSAGVKICTIGIQIRHAVDLLLMPAQSTLSHTFDFCPAAGSSLAAILLVEPHMIMATYRDLS